MEEMKYPELLSKETDLKAIEELLKGSDKRMSQSSQYVMEDPVSAGIILSRIVYPAYVLNPHVKEEVEQVLYEMLFETDYDVYVVTLYVMSELFKEKYEIVPFKMSLQKVLEQLSIELNKRETSIQEGLKYPNGYTKKSAWDQLLRYKKVCQEEYGITLF